MPLSTGTVLINRFRIVKVLSQGPAGTIYRAWNLPINGPCVVREMMGLPADARQQIDYTASMMESLSHPNLPRTSEHFILGDGLYLVMDIFEGQELGSLLARSGKMTWGQAKPLADQLCSVISYLHRQIPPIIHGNIQPNNVYVNPEGRVFLTGLGSALMSTAGSAQPPARSLTAGYASPEQYSLPGLDPRVDIYAIGAILFTMLTGQAPPDGQTRKVDDRLITVRNANPSVPTHVDEAIRRAMLVKVSERFASVDEFQAALAGASTMEMHQGMEDFLHGVNRPAPPRPTPSGPLPSPGRWMQPAASAAGAQSTPPPPDQPHLVTREQQRPIPAPRRLATWVTAVTMFLVLAVCGVGALMTLGPTRLASAPIASGPAASATRGVQATAMALAQATETLGPPVAAAPLSTPTLPVAQAAEEPTAASPAPAAGSPSLVIGVLVLLGFLIILIAFGIIVWRSRTKKLK